MEKLTKIFDECLSENLNQIIVSNVRKADATVKVVVRPFIKKNQLFFQFSSHTKTQVFHENVNREEAAEKLKTLLLGNFKQIDIFLNSEKISALVNKKGKATIKRDNKVKLKKLSLSHNREKNYLIDASIPIPFLVELGVQTRDGKIVDKMNKKFKQINRFLEFIRDVLPKLDKNKKLTIIDFGCGKSYLTFAMYHFFKIQNEYDVNMIGLDLKKDVIEKCNRLAKKFAYTDLKFYEGDINTFEGVDSVDMVVTLHACDVATDYALYKAIKWGASVILSVPCCQHEMNRQIKSDLLFPVSKYGILKERMSAILTDGIRANLLEKNGYDVQILEFIDMEHTPKNILIRAVKSNKTKTDDDSYERLIKELNFSGTLEKLLKESEEKQ